MALSVISQSTGSSARHEVVCPRSQTYQGSCFPARRVTPCRTRRCLPQRPQTARPRGTRLLAGGDVRASSYGRPLAIEVLESVLRKLLPTAFSWDVHSGLQASQSHRARRFLLNCSLAIRSPPISPAAVVIDTPHIVDCSACASPSMPSAAGRQSCRRCGVGMGQNKTLRPKHLHRLACRADARERFEEVGECLAGSTVRPKVKHDIATLVLAEASTVSRGQ